MKKGKKKAIKKGFRDTIKYILYTAQHLSGPPG